MRLDATKQHSTKHHDVFSPWRIFTAKSDHIWKSELCSEKKNRPSKDQPIISTVKLARHSRKGGPLDPVGETVERSPRSESRSGSKLNSQTGGCGDRPATGTGTDERRRRLSFVVLLLDARVASPFREGKRERQKKQTKRRPKIINGRKIIRVSFPRSTLFALVDRLSSRGVNFFQSQRDFWAQSKCISDLIEAERIWRAQIRNEMYDQRFSLAKKSLDSRDFSRYQFYFGTWR